MSSLEGRPDGPVLRARSTDEMSESPEGWARRVEPDDWLTDLFDRHYLALVRLAAQMVDDRWLSEEVVQDAFASLQRRGMTGLNDPLSYLRSAVLNGARSLLRRRRIARLVRLDAPQVATHPADTRMLEHESNRAVLAAIAALPLRQKQVVVLRYYEELSTAEIGRVLKIRPTAVTSSLSRALRTLSETLPRGSS